MNERELTFVDYFVICGLEASLGLELERYAGALESGDNKPPLERSYVAKILGCYPETRKDRPFPEEVLALCMPRGLRFCTQKDVSSEPEFHTVANMRADGSRIDGCSLTYYEQVMDESLCDAMHSLHTMHVRHLTGKDETHTQQQLIQNGYHPSPGAQSGGAHTLPRRGRAHRLKRTSYYDSGKDNLFVMKTICLISRLPVVAACESILRTIHKLIVAKEQPPLPIESYVFWLLHEVPLPPAGSTLKVTLESSDIICQRPGSDELPFFDYSLREVFDLLTVEKFLKIYTCVLLEHQILLCSKVLHRLMLVAESFASLCFPFRWQHVYVPILPYSQALFLEAPLPFVMGLCYDDAIDDEVFQSTVCVVDIDTGRVELPEDLPIFPDRGELASELQLIMDRFQESSRESDSIVFRQHRARKDDWALKRWSRSFDDDALGNILGDNNNSLTRDRLAPLPLSVLQESESLARVTEIARKAGVNVALDSLQRELESTDTYRNSPSSKRYFQDMKLNNAIREIFVNRFTSLFYSYEHFVIGANCADRESFVSMRDSMHNFDKASFLSDQPDSHLNFLAAFIETQMFATFIDWKILSQWEVPDGNLELFDRRIREMQDKFGQAMVRTPTYESCPTFAATEEMISKREDALDFIVPSPHPLDGMATVPHTPGLFPLLNPNLLKTPLPSPQRSPWKQRHRHLRKKDNSEFSPEAEETKPVEWLKHLVSQNGRPRPLSICGGSGVGDLSPAQIAQTNWKFVEQLLRETKGKTKRMLVEKMGREAIELGHTDLSITGVEENTLVAAFCDLLERIWAHGLNKKQGKSALWTHLLSQQELDKGLEQGKAIHSSAYLSPGQPHPMLAYLQNLQKDLGADSQPWSSSLLRAASYIADKMGSAGMTHSASSQSLNAMAVADFAPQWTAVPQDSSVPESPRKRSLSRPRSPDYRQCMKPLPVEMAYDLKNVLRMSEIKTDIGYARAFVRLALERKLLHKHIKTLLANYELLRQLYKRYAFLRCEDEKEQFLYHVLSLNAADFRCFTNTFTRTKMQYQVLLVPGGGRFTLANSAASIWVRLAGSLGQTVAIHLPKNTLQFTFDHKNLGVLSTLRIGHEHNAVSPGGSTVMAHPKWFLEEVIVRNEITGHTYRFPCARWFGRAVDDGSLERLLVAQEVPLENVEGETPMMRCRTPPRARSPSASRRGENPKTRIMEIQRRLGECVNEIVKHFYRNSEKEQRSELTRLLCGESGLVAELQQVFIVGFRSGRFFRQHYPWDYIEKVTAWFYDQLRLPGSENMSKDRREVIRHCCTLVAKITRNSALGKEGKFQAFILISIRDHLLSALLPLMAWTPITSTLYEELSFLRSAPYLTFVTKLLNSLNEFHFDLEQSLTWGVDA